ncbi:hypothetical protein [Tenacibaculum maritimum]|uniref:hypothetical protein n=1 Tax=Tenacibaculum maritimum TaxID=107401 RepID=UPI0012E43357|nr:hypothetical protein [Tenacibaculum maritimum]CAA0214031.1 hypothetical protein FS0810_290020 [Tenacibaculum maritimum]
MNLNIIEDYELLEGGININYLEKLIYRLVNLFYIYNISWSEGIKRLNDLIYLKEHDNSKLSNRTGRLILTWIKSKYKNNVFNGFTGSYISNDQKSMELVLLMDLTLDTIIKIHYNTDTFPFLNSILQKSSNTYETNEIKNLIERLNYINESPKQNISDKIAYEILLNVDNYFEREYNSENSNYLFCGLPETIREHKLCYTINWCIKSDKYSPKSNKGWVGAGPLMLSKTFDKFEKMGSSPAVDWLYLFELSIQGLEEYFYLEIPYKKENLLKLKSVIKCSTEELLKMVNKQGLIIYTELKKWCDFRPEFQYISDDLNKLGINSKVEIKTRKIK